MPVSFCSPTGCRDPHSASRESFARRISEEAAGGFVILSKLRGAQRRVTLSCSLLSLATFEPHRWPRRAALHIRGARRSFTFWQNQVPDGSACSGGGDLARCPPMPRRHLSRTETPTISSRAANGGANEFWMMSIQIALGVISLFGIAA